LHLEEHLLKSVLVVHHVLIDVIVDTGSALSPWLKNIAVVSGEALGEQVTSDKVLALPALLRFYLGVGGRARIFGAVARCR